MRSSLNSVSTIAIALGVLGVTAVAALTGALKDAWLAATLIVVALLAPSPMTFALKIKDWIEVRRQRNSGGSESNERK